MKTFFTILLLISSLASADHSADSCYQMQEYEGTFDKLGDSFVCMGAYDVAVQKAYDDGAQNCKTKYRTSLSTSLFNSDHYYCTAYVKCEKVVCSNNY